MVSISIGGDAVEGKSENGKYFVGHRGIFTEVSHGVYQFSRFHSYSIWVTHPLGILLAIVFLRQGNKK